MLITLLSILPQSSLVHIQLLWIRKESYNLQPTPSTSRWCVSLNRGLRWKENIQVCWFLFHISHEVPLATPCWLFHTNVVISHKCGSYLECCWDFVFITPRFLPTPPPSHDVCTEFLLPANWSGAGHQMWYPGNSLHADQQQLCTDEPGLVCSLYIWIHATKWGCKTCLYSSASDSDCGFKVRMKRL